MTTVPATTDSVTPYHETLLTAGLEMANNSVNRWYELDRSGRRELLAAWADFCQNLAALGVAVPADPKGL